MFEDHFRTDKKIMIMSDSHSRVDLTQNAINFAVSQKCEYIIHAGDICKEENLKIIHNSGLKYIIVYGNNDFNLMQFGDIYDIKQEPYHFKLFGLNFKLMHLPFYLNGDADVIIYGHTHVFEASIYSNTLIINPGEVCAREKPLSEFLILNISKNRFVVEKYSTNIHTNEFKKEIMEFKK